MTTLHKIRNLYREWQRGLISNNKFFCDLGKLSPTLPQKEKECKHKFIETYTGGKRCNKCNMSLTEFKHSTPSPLDQLEEVEEVWEDYPTLQNTEDKAINSLIKNQKILIDYIKSL